MAVPDPLHERRLERKHQVDARVRGHARLVQVRMVIESLDIDGQTAVLLDDLSDLVAHASRLVREPPCVRRVGSPTAGSIRQSISTLTNPLLLPWSGHSYGSTSR